MDRLVDTLGTVGAVVVVVVVIAVLVAIVWTAWTLALAVALNTIGGFGFGVSQLIGLGLVATLLGSPAAATQPR